MLGLRYQKFSIFSLVIKIIMLFRRLYTSNIQMLLTSALYNSKCKDKKIIPKS